MIQLDQAETYDFYFKILAGEQQVGKTCIISKFANGKFPKNSQPTIGVEVFSKIITLIDGSKVKAQMWDTAGQERYRSITSKKSVGALLVFDLTNEKTLLQIDRWYNDIKNVADSDIIMFLVGNKLDIIESHSYLRKVSFEEANDFAQNHKMKYFEISAQTGQNLDKCFQELFKEICKQKSGYRGGEQSQLNMIRQQNQRNKEECKC